MSPEFSADSSKLLTRPVVSYVVTVVAQTDLRHAIRREILTLAVPPSTVTSRPQMRISHGHGDKIAVRLVY